MSRMSGESTRYGYGGEIDVWWSNLLMTSLVLVVLVVLVVHYEYNIDHVLIW